MSRQTLIETQLFTLSPQAITEAVKTERGNLLVEGRLQAAETKNGNGRYYPREILEREVENYKKGPIAENRALGELDHPDSSVINLKNVSHNIKDTWWDGDNIIQALNDPDIFQIVQPNGCPIVNAYNSVPVTSGGISAALSNMPENLCTNNFRWYDDTASGGTNLSLMITGTIACGAARFSKNKSSYLTAEFEIVRASSILIFETIPQDAAPDLWYEGEASYPIDTATGAHLGNTSRYASNTDQVVGTTDGIIFSQFFNCYMFGNGAESYRIKDSISGKTITLGNRAFSTSAQDYKEAQ